MVVMYDIPFDYVDKIDKKTVMGTKYMKYEVRGRK